MPFQWGNLLPSAFDQAAGVPAAVNASTQAMYSAGLTDQQAQAAAIANRQKQYDLGLQKTTEALMAAAMGPQGVDQDKFYALASKTPYGVSAVKAYADVAFPQGQK